jgi:hypothetical protein
MLDQTGAKISTIRRAGRRDIRAANYRARPQLPFRFARERAFRDKALKVFSQNLLDYIRLVFMWGSSRYWSVRGTDRAAFAFGVLFSVFRFPWRRIIGISGS